jgi:hypothetical protein
LSIATSSTATRFTGSPSSRQAWNAAQSTRVKSGRSSRLWKDDRHEVSMIGRWSELSIKQTDAPVGRSPWQLYQERREWRCACKEPWTGNPARRSSRSFCPRNHTGVNPWLRSA